MHTLDISGPGGQFDDLFRDAIDGRAALGVGVPLSTAVHLSARFTYVSPAGTARNHAIPGESSAAWMRLVDGGYFENSGTVTAHELLVAVQALLGAQDADPAVARLRPFVIHISNEPVPLSPGEPPQASCLQRDHWSEARSLAGDPKQKALGEVLSPLLALLNVRPARGFQAREALFVRMGGNGPSARRVHFQLYDLGTELPLGWVLSNKARMDIRAQLGTGDVTAAAERGEQARDQPDGRTRWVEDCNRALMERVLGFLDAAR
jgi:hypothetical protein